MTEHLTRPRLAVDIGGTFVDAIVFDPATGEVRLHKAATTPHDPSVGVLAAVAGLNLPLADVGAFVHGTTLGLNAILQRRGARVGLITNDGFRDILEVARANVPDASMYDFAYLGPPPIARRRHRLGVAGRLDAQGTELVPLDEEGVARAADELVLDHGLSSIAICFLHSYLNPAHERRAAEIIRDRHPNVEVSPSVDISREYREYERTSTAVLDAYIKPLLSDYVHRLEQSMRSDGFTGAFHVLRSGGGAMTADMARGAPLLTVLSGPAGGIAGACHLARTLGWDQVISFDVGGTSLDACVIENGEASSVYEAEIDGLPMQLPVFDIRTIGAGGGSVARADDGLLRVGPQSAGAVPGPACYGIGGEDPTVTDAALVLGMLDADSFLGGAMTIDAAAAEKAVGTRLAEPLGLDPVRAAAQAIRVVLARTMSAVREITVERGLDPRTFRLLAFGGAGPLLSPALGRELGVAEIVVPRAPAAFSAFGMLMADLEYDASATAITAMTPEGLADLGPLIAELSREVDRTLAEQDVTRGDRRIVPRLDMRYRGQEHTLTVELTGQDTAEDLADRFGALHAARHGHRLSEACEVVTVRVRGVGALPSPVLPVLPPASCDPSPLLIREVFDLAADVMRPTPVYERDTLGAGSRIEGPAVVTEPTSTTVLASDQALVVDDHGHLLITTTQRAA